MPIFHLIVGFSSPAQAPGTSAFAGLSAAPGERIVGLTPHPQSVGSDEPPQEADFLEAPADYPPPSRRRIGRHFVGAGRVGASWLMHRPCRVLRRRAHISLISRRFRRRSGGDGLDLGEWITADRCKVDGFIVALSEKVSFHARGPRSMGEKPSVPGAACPLSILRMFADSIVVRTDDPCRRRRGHGHLGHAVSRMQLASYRPDARKTFINGDHVDPGHTYFSRVTWPVVVVCYLRDMAQVVQNFDYLCLGWNKDGNCGDMKCPVLRTSRVLAFLKRHASRFATFLPPNFGCEDARSALLHLPTSPAESATYNVDTWKACCGRMAADGRTIPGSAFLVTISRNRR